MDSSSLVSQILAARQSNPTGLKLDERGVPIMDGEGRVGYLAARAMAKFGDRLYRDPLYEQAVGWSDSLWLRGRGCLAHTDMLSGIYGTTDMAFQLCGLEVKPGEARMLYMALLELVPELDRSIIQITDDLYWSKRYGLIIKNGV